MLPELVAARVLRGPPRQEGAAGQAMGVRQGSRARARTQFVSRAKTVRAALPIVRAVRGRPVRSRARLGIGDASAPAMPSVLRVNAWGPIAATAPRGTAGLWYATPEKLVPPRAAARPERHGTAIIVRGGVGFAKAFVAVRRRYRIADSSSKKASGGDGGKDVQTVAGRVDSTASRAIVCNPSRDALRARPCMVGFQRFTGPQRDCRIRAPAVRRHGSEIIFRRTKS